ncbi:hypothetical protein D7Z54_07415 [Salibacterium salarium]|uniref:SWIM-type domain-containing protein n=1 Tax=Salibacterium salarium TaxID=284579 RepID=A0A3R9QN43_9BACI|nr:SWIM zinc finger family protein [Salibacterium salarium]RSL33938.1 hypothetical protein D7Z54_07415 [Salibacterium salarium]
MNLFDIEDFIDDDTFSRGMMYIVEEQVRKIQEPYQHHFVIEVEGAEDYTVDIVLDAEKNIVKTFCDCPSVPGTYCEHTAAALMALGEHKEESTLGGNFEEEPDLDTVLASLSKEDMMKLLRAAAEEYPEVKKRVLSAHTTSLDAAAAARKLVREYIEKNVKDHFISFRDVPDALEGAHMVLEQAEEKTVGGETEQAVQLCLVVLAEVVDMLKYADDSGGEPGVLIHQSLVLLHQAAATGARQLQESAKECVFDSLLAEADQRRYGDMIEWRTSLLRACIYIADSTERRSRLEGKIEQMQKEIPADSWQAMVHTPLIKMIQLEIRETYDSEEAVSTYLYENLSYPEFRRKALDMFMIQGAFDRVLELCDKALEGEEFPHLRRQWKEYKLDVYEQTGDIQNQKAILLEFLYDGDDRYYERLKRLYGPEEWGDVFQEILDGFDRNNAHDLASYLMVLKEERLSGRILDYCRNEPRRIMDWYPYLTEDYPEEVNDLFVLVIKNTAEQSRDRKKYRKVCQLIQQYQKACGSNNARNLIDVLKEMYQKRSAFVDELEKINK